MWSSCSPRQNFLRRSSVTGESRNRHALCRHPATTIQSNYQRLAAIGHRAALLSSSRGYRRVSGRPRPDRGHTDSLGEKSGLQSAGIAHLPRRTIGPRAVPLSAQSIGPGSGPDLATLAAAVSGEPPPQENRLFAAIYDGDTTTAERARLRKQPPPVLITNPDMLHLSLLPYHDSWSSFFKGLRVIVIDEVHVYRGLFGAHLAWVLRRLQLRCLLRILAALYHALGNDRQSRAARRKTDRSKTLR